MIMMMPATPAFTVHTSFTPLISQYSTFLLDQFGVIHNGSQGLHGASDCIQSMIDQKKKLAILSNTSSPSHVALKRLPRYGLRSEMFAGGLVSSGEECAKYVRKTYCENESDTKAKKKKKALWLTWQESEKQNPLEFLSYCERRSGSAGAGGTAVSIDIAQSVDEADFILLHGSEVWRRCRDLPSESDSKDDDDDAMIQDLNFLFNEDYSTIETILEQSIKRNLPMVCANPDLIVGLPGGKVGNMPGKIAQKYIEKGGTVQQFGKPNPRHFHACLDNLGINYDANAKIPDVLHVGDSLEHDVAGANAAGIDSVFVLGGIHAKELGLIPTGCEEGSGIVITEDDIDIDAAVRQDNMAYITKTELTAKLETLFEEKDIWPTHVVPRFSL